MSAYSDKVIADGCSAYWRLGEASGTTAFDSVGTAHGTISGGVTLGQAGALADGDKAMSFNAAGEYVSVPNGSYAAIGTGPLTVECWLKPEPAMPGTTPFILDNGGGANGSGFGILRGSATNIYFKIANGTTNSVATFPFPFDGQWHHVVGVLTRGGTDTLQVIVDGIAAAPTEVPVTGWNISSSLALSLAVYSGGGASPDFRYFGAIDEVAIYPTALTAPQIAAHYALSKYKTGSYPSLVIADGCSAYWRLGETSGTVANDELGMADGTISGGVTLAQPGALADGDKAMAFDGANGLIKMAGMQNYPFGTGPLSVECWLKSTFIAGTRWMLDCGKNADNAVPGFEIYQNADHSYTFRPGDGTTTLYLVTPAPFPVGQWLHLVCLIERLYDGVHDRGRIYVNGVHSVSADIAVAGINVTPTAAGMSLGGIFNGGIHWGGLLDDVAIYPIALTPAQIAAHFEARLFSDANLPTVPWAIVGGMAPWSNDMDAYNVWSPITPHDSNDIADGVTDAILVGGAGDVAAVMQNKQVVVLKGLPAGAWVPVAARRVNSTGTTATNLVALYQV